MASLFGESDGDSFYRCPGDSCDIWMATGGEYEERSKVCLDCSRCKGKPPLLNGSNSPEEVKKRVIARIENIVNQQNAGTLDLHNLDFFEWKLLEIWRNEEIAQQRQLQIYPRLIFESLSRQ